MLQRNSYSNTKIPNNQNISIKRSGSSFVTFYNPTWVFLYTARQLLINGPLWRGYFGSLERALVAVAVVERLKQE